MPRWSPDGGREGFMCLFIFGKILAGRSTLHVNRSWTTGKGLDADVTKARNLENDRLIRALLRQPVDRTPVWIMRQAGRYLPEYRALRRRAGDFLRLCKTPELAMEATLQPLDRYPLDAAILFSDILTIPDAMGLGLSMEEHKGPCFATVVRDRQSVSKLPVPEPCAQLQYVLEAVRRARAALAGRVPLIGFSGSPWTLACYMVEGGGSREFRHVREMLYAQPDTLRELLDKLARAVVRYLNAQIEAGVQVVMLFDSWGGLLDWPRYEQFSLAYMRQVLAGLHREYAGCRVPSIVFSKGAGLWVEHIAASGCDAVGLDWTQDIAQVRRQIGERVAVQGNMDPAALYATPESIREEVARILAAYGNGHGHVFNLGHGIQPQTDPERLAVCIEAVQALSGQYHR